MSEQVSDRVIKYRCTNCQLVYAVKQTALECCTIQEVEECSCGRTYALPELIAECREAHETVTANE